MSSCTIVTGPDSERPISKASIAVGRAPEWCKSRQTDAIAAIASVCLDLHHSGALPTAIDAFEMGLSESGPVTIVQDDIVTCLNFSEYVRRFAGYIESQRQIVKWFHPGLERWAPYLVRPRLAQYSPDRFVGTQAVTYSSHWARKIVNFLKSLAVLDNPPPINGDDNWICEALKTYGQNFYVHRPSI